MSELSKRRSLLSAAILASAALGAASHSAVAQIGPPAGTGSGGGGGSGTVVPFSTSIQGVGLFFVDEFGGNIQSAVNAAVAASGGEVWLGPHDYTLTSGSAITVDLATGVTIHGFGPTSRILAGAIPSGTPVFTFASGTETMVPLQGVQICASGSGRVTASISTGGSGHSNFVHGSCAIMFSGSSDCTIRDVQMCNFDRTTQWNTGGNINGIDFDNCLFAGCNKGWCIDTVVPNSFEKMSVTKSIFSTCNYGAYLTIPDQFASFFVDDCSIDNSPIAHIFFNGSTDTFNQAIWVSRNKLRTNSASSGTGPRVLTSGAGFLSDNSWTEDGTPPSGFIGPNTNGNGRLKLVNNHQICTSNIFTSIPWVTSPANGSNTAVQGFGNSWGQQSETILVSATDGVIAGESDITEAITVVEFDPTTGNIQAQRRQFWLDFGATGNGSSGSPFIFAVAPDSVFNHATSTTIVVYQANTSAIFWTVTPGSGVSVTADNGSPLTFSTPGSKFELIKTGPNTWRWHQTGAPSAITTASLASGPSYANDTAAAAGGVGLGLPYRNGSIVQVRVS